VQAIKPANMPGILMWTFVMQAIDTLALNLQNKWVFVVQAIDTLAVTLQNKWVFIMQAIDTLVLNLQNRWCLSRRQLIHWP